MNEPNDVALYRWSLFARILEARTSGLYWRMCFVPPAMQQGTRWEIVGKASIDSGVVILHGNVEIITKIDMEIWSKLDNGEYPSWNQTQWWEYESHPGQFSTLTNQPRTFEGDYVDIPEF